MDSNPGTYALIFQIETERSLKVGRLGTLYFFPGFYLYVGSAFGPGGIQARVGRHLKKLKRVRWHVDYLSAEADLLEVWNSCFTEKQEHEWASKLGSAGSAAIIPGFGSSDCFCESHLFYFKTRPT